MLKAALFGHSNWWIVVVLAMVLVITVITDGLVRRRRWKKLDHVLSLIFVIALDIQFLLGGLLWVVMRKWQTGLAGVEHPVTMITAIAVAHIGFVKVKKSESDAGRFKAAAAGFLIASALVCFGIWRVIQK